jgi:putative Holliday junction resolvase
LVWGDIDKPDPAIKVAVDKISLPRTERHMSGETSLEALAKTLPSRGPLIGLDLGTKTIGLAISDVERRIASPLETIRRTRFTADVALLLGHVTRHGVAAIVLGMPLNMDGSEGPRAQATRAFLRSLSQKTDLPIVLWDERLSTAAVTRTLLEADASRKRRGELVDKMAAAYILQGAIDRLAMLSGTTSPGKDS